MESSGRILIVEDHERWRHFLCRALQRAGFQTDAASTVAEAWELIRVNAYNLAVLDLSLSAEDGSNDDGFQLLRQLNEGGFLGAMRVVILTGFGTRAQMREAFMLHGASDFLNKMDFDSDLFVRQVQQIIAGR